MDAATAVPTKQSNKRLIAITQGNVALESQAVSAASAQEHLEATKARIAGLEAILFQGRDDRLLMARIFDQIKSENQVYVFGNAWCCVQPVRNGNNAIATQIDSADRHTLKFC